MRLKEQLKEMEDKLEERTAVSSFENTAIDWVVRSHDFEVVLRAVT